MKTITAFKNFFSLALVIVLGQTTGSAASKLYFSDFSIAADAEQEIQLLFDTDADDIKNIDAIITLPDGLSFMEFEQNVYAELNEDRLGGMISFNYATGSLKIKGLGEVIEEGEGAIATFKVKATNSLAASSSISVDNIVVTHNDNTTENLDATIAAVTLVPDLAFTSDTEFIELAAGETKDVVINMASTKKISMFQATLILPEGITATVTKGDRLKNDPSYNPESGMIAVTSGIKNTEGSLFIITLKADDTITPVGEVKLTAITATTSSAVAYFADDVTISVNQNPITGITTLETIVQNDDIYTLSGKKVKAATKGLYIVKGKIVVVK